ncbi:MAG TPA: NTP transferase domain-containing protein [Candidatus Paceibacterota bacterium]
MAVEKIQIIILAAGKGTRMNNDLPKVLVPLAGQPIIKHLLDRIKDLEFGKPYIVVGHGKEAVIKELGGNYNYVEQKEQLGTGHAVNAVKHGVKNEASSIVVLYGDQPFTTADTINKLVEKQVGMNKKIVMATVELEDFQDWRSNFVGFSRVIRDKNRKILKTVEYNDATEEEKGVKEVNPCYFCFDAQFLWQELEKLKTDNTQGEYYLTDVLKSAVEQGIDIESIQIDPREALGANSKEELEILEKLMVK